MLNERSQKQKTTYCMIRLWYPGMTRMGKSPQMGSRFIAAWGWGVEGIRSDVNERGVSSGGNENVLKLDRGDGCTTLRLY